MRRAVYHSDIPTWISHHSDVPHHNFWHILEHGLWSYSLTWNCSQDKIIILIATEKLVSETSHGLNLNLYLGFALRARSWLRNMLHDSSFVNLILSLIISKQRVLPRVLPHTYLGSTTFLFVICLFSITLRTLWIQNPAFIEQCILRRPDFFCTRPSNRPYVQNWHKQVNEKPEVLHSAKLFSIHHILI